MCAYLKFLDPLPETRFYLALCVLAGERLRLCLMIKLVWINMQYYQNWRSANIRKEHI